MLVVPQVSLVDFPWNNAYYLCPFFLILVCGLYPLRLAFDLAFPDFDPQIWPFIQSRSWINLVFASHCFEIFFCLFVLYACLKYRSVKSSSTVNIDEAEGTINYNEVVPKLTPFTQTDRVLVQFSSSQLLSSTDILSKFVGVQLAKLASLYLPLVILIVTTFVVKPSLFELIQKATGGKCSTNHEYYRSCLVDGGRYSGGFKVSGHCLVTSSFTLFLTWEFIMFRVWYNCKSKYTNLLLHVLFAVVATCWITLFVITCMFYHTFLERLLGTILGTSLFFLCFLYFKF